VAGYVPGGFARAVAGEIAAVARAAATPILHSKATILLFMNILSVSGPYRR
jgi:hypothetical protein